MLTFELVENVLEFLMGGGGGDSYKLDSWCEKEMYKCPTKARAKFGKRFGFSMDKRCIYWNFNFNFVRSMKK